MKYFKKQFSVLLVALMVLAMMPITAFAAVNATVIASSLNVRKSANTSSAKVGSLTKGQTVSIQSESNGWSQISYNGTTAYVASMYLTKTSTGTTTQTPSATGNATVTASRLNIRTGMSTSTGVVTVLTKGTKVTILSTSGSYYYISVSGKVGYAPTQYFQVDASVAAPAAPAAPAEPAATNPPSSGTTTSTATVMASRLNIRTGMSTSTGVVTVVSSGTKVTVLSTSGSYYYVSVGGKVGYAPAQYFKLDPTSGSAGTTNPTTSNTLGTATVTASRLNIRTGMSTSTGVVTVLPSGTQVTVNFASGSYYNINVSGKTGYAPKQYFSAITPAPTPTPTPVATPTPTPTPTVSLPQTAGTSTKLAGKTVIVDAGHGGSDPGAVYGASEKTINLAVATKLKQYLEDNGATVIMTRTTDTYIDLYSRPAYANRELLKLENTNYSSVRLATAQGLVDDANDTKDGLTTLIDGLKASKQTKTERIEAIDTEVISKNDSITDKLTTAAQKTEAKQAKQAIIDQIDENEEVTVPSEFTDKVDYRAGLVLQIAALDADITLQTAVATLTAEKAILETDITSLNTQISNKESEKSTLQTSLDALMLDLADKQIYDNWVELTITQFNTDATTTTGNNNRRGVIGTAFALNDNLKKVFDIGPKYNNLIFVSIHANAAGTSGVSGMEVYTTVAGDSTGDGYGTYAYNATTRLRLAQNILDEATAASTMPERSVFTKSLAVTRETNIPAVLVELGYMTNANDLAMLTNSNYQNAAAVGIANGVIKYFTAK